MEIGLKQKLHSMIVMGTMVRAEMRQEVSGGYKVNILSEDLEKLSAFMPYSHSHTKGVSSFDVPSFRVNIIEIDSRRGSVVVSAREYISGWVDEQKDIFLGSLYVGQAIDGKVNNIVDFGVFIDVGQISGLIHKNKIDGRSYNKGDKVRVEVESIDLRNRRLGLAPYTRKDSIKSRIRQIIKLPKHHEPKIRYETMEPKKLKKLIADMSRDEALSILPKLRKRADWSIKKVLSGNADWYTVYINVTENVSEGYNV